MTSASDLPQTKLDRLFSVIESRKQAKRDERQKDQDQRIQKLTTRRPLWWHND